tara:strand:- start:48 stop:866 length:819 start_codon:yes stop_codon:yes gene_type:complete
MIAYLILTAAAAIIIDLIRRQIDLNREVAELSTALRFITAGVKDPPKKKKETIKKIPSTTGVSHFMSRMNAVQNRPEGAVNDEILTPPEIAAQQIKDTEDIWNLQYGGDDLYPMWMDGFKNTGTYYNQFPEGVLKDYTEIIEGKDFFKHTRDYDIICSNPPFSLMSTKKKYGFIGGWETIASIHKPKIISLVTGKISISTVLIERMADWGYTLVLMNQFKVQEWVPSCYTIWVRDAEEGTETIFRSDNKMYQKVAACQEYHDFHHPDGDQMP